MKSIFTIFFAILFSSILNSAEVYTEKINVKQESVKALFWLISYQCNPEVTIQCCCADGNSYTYTAIGAAFTCIPRGSFECSSDLSGCEPNPSAPLVLVVLVLDLND
jgi:hypothetical protein